MPNLEPYPSDVNDVEWELAKWREKGLWQEINDHLREVVREKRANPPVLQSSTRRVLRWLITPECEAVMRARKSEGENGIWW